MPMRMGSQANCVGWVLGVNLPQDGTLTNSHENPPHHPHSTLADTIRHQKEVAVPGLACDVGSHLVVSGHALLNGTAERALGRRETRTGGSVAASGTLTATDTSAEGVLYVQ